jgi:hypothetical protein
MPKRTNEFQELVSILFQQLAAFGVSAKESELLPEGNEGRALREVDSLFQVNLGFTELKVAIEVRNHSKKQTITWIDELIGKYSQLGVNKIIAVSSSGFTSAASKKATANNIDLFSLSEAIDLNWGQIFLSLGVASLSLSFHPEVEFGIQLENPLLPQSFFQNASIRCQRADGGLACLPLPEFIRELVDETIDLAKCCLDAKFLDIYRTRADLERHPVFEREMKPCEAWIINEEIEERIAAITAKVRFVSNSEECQASNRILTKAGNAQALALVTSASCFGIPLTIIQKNKLTEDACR